MPLESYITDVIASEHGTLMGIFSYTCPKTSITAKQSNTLFAWPRAVSLEQKFFILSILIAWNFRQSIRVLKTFFPDQNSERKVA